MFLTQIIPLNMHFHKHSFHDDDDDFPHFADAFTHSLEMILHPA